MNQLKLDMPDDTEGSANSDETAVPRASGDGASSDVGGLLYCINNMMNTKKRQKDKDRRWEEQDPRLSNGDIAELRRISPRAPITPALWRVLHHLGIADAPYATSEKGQADYERKWAVLLMGMAHCAGLHDTRKRENRISFGRALAEAGWSEQRFVQLLETDPDRLGVQIRRVAQFLAAKNQRADWRGVYWLLFLKDEKAEATRLRLARSYYGTLYYQEKENDDK